jgi:thiol-disulfide isomerase/thioredoxin
MSLRAWKYWPWLRDGLVMLLIIAAVRAYQQRDLPSGVPPEVSGASLDGAQVSLADYRSKPVLLHFWATWCGVCRAEQGSIDAIAKTLPVLSIASQSGRASQVKQYVDEHGLQARVLVDESNALARSFNVHSYPTTFVLDANGVIRFSEVGYTTELGLRARMWLASLW